jgi:hypothetical protein
MTESVEVKIAKLEGRITTLEANEKEAKEKAQKLEGKIWSGVVLIVAYVGNQILGLLKITGAG